VWLLLRQPNSMLCIYQKCIKALEWLNRYLKLKYLGLKVKKVLIALCHTTKGKWMVAPSHHNPRGILLRWLQGYILCDSYLTESHGFLSDWIVERAWNNILCWNSQPRKLWFQLGRYMPREPHRVRTGQ
jgi:hypothetical protein